MGLGPVLEDNRMTVVKLTLYTKSDCELCKPFKEEVLAVLDHAKWRDQLVYSEVNILEDEIAFAKYHEKIPVLEVEGKLAFKYFIKAEELEQLLCRRFGFDRT
jgi:hypothetical protein